LDKRIDYFINKNNKFGQQGKFLDMFKALYWIKKSKIGDTALNLKKMVGKIKEDFNNSQQQDANEYLNFLIDTLHEEINMHASKIYIEERDEVFNNNTIDEVGNIYWANGLRRNASFIDSVFMFQLKSNLKCKRCNTVKYNFENNYMFNLPLSLCKMVTVEIYLYKLPFIYKLYYSEINPKFKEYISKPQNSKLSITQNLWNFYSEELTLE
jgi:ubiquitin carboxyl-terminal hydrolase 8